MPKLEQDLFRFLKANLLEEDEDGQRLAINFVHMPAIASYCAHLCLALAFESCARKTTMWEKTSTQIHWGHTCLCIFSGTTIFHLTRLLSFLSAHRYSYLQSYYITYIYISLSLSLPFGAASSALPAIYRLSGCYWSELEGKLQVWPQRQRLHSNNAWDMCIAFYGV